MAKPKLPSRPADVWQGGFLLDQAREVRSISARGGLVIAGGTDLYLLKVGDQHFKTRPPPLDIGPVLVAAAEPRQPRRYAVASAELIAVFWKNKQGDQILRLRQNPPGPRATHLAWGGEGSPTSLWIRREDGAVLRMKPDLSDMDELDVAPMDAVASDDNGVIAMISSAEERVYVTRDGEHMAFRHFGWEVDADAHAYLAVAGTAVAVAYGHGGALLSRGDEDELEAVAELAGAGPVEFEGPDPGAALFGAIHERNEGAIVRVDEDGTSMRIAEYGADGGDAPVIDSLSWDVSRKTLWGASPQAGLISSIAPGAKGAKKPMLS